MSKGTNFGAMLESMMESATSGITGKLLEIKSSIEALELVKRAENVGADTSAAKKFLLDTVNKELKELVDIGESE